MQKIGNLLLNNLREGFRITLLFIVGSARMISLLYMNCLSGFPFSVMEAFYFIIHNIGKVQPSSSYLSSKLH